MRKGTPRAAAAAFALCALLAGCSQVGNRTPQKITPVDGRTQSALRADAVFWDALHHGRYDRIGGALETESEAFLSSPRDAVTASHIGWLHLWRFVERARVGSTPAAVLDDVLLARRYFEEAVSLNPDDARYKGMLAVATLFDGNIHQNERLSTRGYFDMHTATDAWPEFNLFAGGYALGNTTADSQRFNEALSWQWERIDRCIGTKIDRATPDMRSYMTRETREGPKRACWNSTTAPHNFEGFFLNMGDMVVKAGDVRTGRLLYANAKLSATYDTWPFKSVLEARLRGSAGIMFSSTYACMACHQE